MNASARFFVLTGRPLCGNGFIVVDADALLCDRPGGFRV